MSKRVFITGATGFLGAHIAHSLINQGNQVYALIRKSSDLWRCKEYIKSITWLFVEDEKWQKDLISFQPDIIVHCAWIGVSADERNDMIVQQENLHLCDQLLSLVSSLKLEKFICLGSQAEYGNINGCIDESFPEKPNTAYGKIKLQVLQRIRHTCQNNNVNWIWLRVFSVFGPLENENWLIPSIIKKMNAEKEMDMTEGKQVYAYLFIEDFTWIVQKIVEKNINSGIYNISSKYTLSLRELAEKLRKLINVSFKINFGALPYRAQQSMHIQGDITKLSNEIGEIPFTDINLALSKTIESYISKNEK